MKKMLLALVLGFAALGTAGAQSVSGEWDASMNTPGGPRPFRILFVQEGEKLTGTVRRTAGDLPLEGTIKGNDVTFRSTLNYNGSPLEMSMSATLVGNEMKGTVDIAGQMQDEFSAKRSSGASTPPRKP